MSTTTPERIAFYEHTQNSTSEERASSATTPVECQMFIFSEHQRELAPPARTKSISDLTRRWEAAGRGEGLRHARARLLEMTTSPDDESLRALRLGTGWSQTDVGIRIGTSQSHVARLEAGTSQPSLDTCRRLAALFGVDLNRIDRAFLALRPGA